MVYIQREQNCRALDTYIKKDYVSVINHMKMNENSKHGTRKKTQKTQKDKKASFPEYYVKKCRIV